MPTLRPTLQPLAQPDEKHPFVGREQELELVASKLAMRCEADDKIDAPVLVFWGGFGVGKSWLLKEIETRTKRGGKNLHRTRPMLPVSVRLDLEPRNAPSIWEQEDSSPTRLKFKDVIYQLWKQLGHELGEPPASPNEHTDTDYAREFVNKVSDCSRDHTPVILLDTLDAVLQRDETTFGRLENHVIEPLALTDQVLVILAGRGELRRWNHFQLSRRVVNHRLADLTSEQVAEQIQLPPDKVKRKEVSEILYERTFGHPLTTYLLAHLLQQEIDLDSATPDQVREAITPELWQLLLRYVTGHMLENVSSRLRDWVLVSSVLRWVNVEPLRALKNMNPLPLDQNGVGEDDSFFLKKIGELQSANFIYWNTDRAAFEFTPAVRRLLAESLGDYPKAPCRAHQAAYEFFKKHLERLPQQLARYLPELYFHYSFYKRCHDDVPAFAREQQDWFSALLNRTALESELPWLELESSLREDDELKALEPEIYQMLVELTAQRGRTRQSSPSANEIKSEPPLKRDSPAEPVTPPAPPASSTAPAMPMSSTMTEELPPMKPLQWIPRSAQEQIKTAVMSTDHSVQVFLVHGGAGTGKTILLRSVGKSLDSPDGLNPTHNWAFLDLYHGDINQSSGIETAIADAFGSEGDFVPFLQERGDFVRLRDLGLTAEDLEKQRTKLAQSFAQAINAYTHKRRAVVAFDTVERAQNEHDLLLRLRGISRDTTTVNGWFAEQFKNWKNCVILLGMRPGQDQTLLLEDLKQVEKERTDFQVCEINLTGLDEAETEAYFAARSESYPVLQTLDQNFRSRLLEATDRHILRLDLALEVLQYGDRAYEFEEALKTQAPLDAHKTIDQLLVSSLWQDQRNSQLQALLRLLVVARKGLDQELLHKLEPTWSGAECANLLEQLKYKPYIKTRPDETRLFLHDEMYDICERYALISPGEIQAISARLRELEQGGRGFVYHLRADPEEAYDFYWRKADEYVRNSRVGVELRYRSDVLWFFKGPSPANSEILKGYPELVKQVERDSPIIAVKRLIMRNRRQDAAEIAEQALPTLLTEAPPDDLRAQLSVNELRGLYGLALVYLNQSQKGIDELQAVLDNLEQRYSHSGTVTEGMRNWRLNLALGKAHNDLGYAHWRNLFHYEMALVEFARALPYFEEADLAEPYANTQDNMARVFGLLARRNRAESLVSDALERRKVLGLEYRIGLSYVSRAHLHTLFGEPHRGVNIADKALNMFTEMGGERGIALARIAKGEALRHKGKLWGEELYSRDECARFFRDADDELGRALQVFESINEPVQRITVYNERGCVAREHAALLRELDPKSENIGTLSRRAVEFLTKSMNLARNMPVLYADGCEDVARVYFQQQDYAQMFRWLDEGAAVVPEEYKINTAVGLADVPVGERVEEFWLMMGKIELLRGHAVLEHGPRPLEEAIQHYAFAVAYFTRFSPAAVRHEATFKQIHHRFKRISRSERDQLVQHVLPDIAERFKIDTTRLASFLRDTFGQYTFQVEPLT